MARVIRFIFSLWWAASSPSRPKYILHGITRSNIIKVARRAGMQVREDDFSLTTVYSADEAFVAGRSPG